MVDVVAAADEKGDDNLRLSPSPDWSTEDGGAKIPGKGGGGRRPAKSPLKFVEARGNANLVISSCCRDRPCRLEDAGRDRFPQSKTTQWRRKRSGRMSEEHQA